MQFIIDSQGVKRFIIGSFTMCASRHDLERLKEQITNALHNDNFVHGWIEIHEPLIGTPNTAPKKWDE